MAKTKKHITRKQNKYSEEEKSRIVQRYKASGLSVKKFAAEEILPRVTVLRFLQIRPKLEKRGKRHPVYNDIGDEVAEWVLRQRSQGLIITNSDFKKKALEIAKSRNITVFKASDGWVTKMKKRNGMRYRASTHTSRKFKFTQKDIEEQEAFYDSAQQITVIDKLDLDKIVNMDQTCMRMVAPYAKTIDKIGAKQVSQSINQAFVHMMNQRFIQSIDQSIDFSQVVTVQPSGIKNTFTVSLANRASGRQLPAVIVFKASDKKTGVLSEKIMSELLIPDNVIVFSSLSGWWNERLDHKWIDTAFEDGETAILVRDQFSVHKMESSEERLEKHGVKQIFVPAGMTGTNQPLDVGVNRPFKAFFTEEYHVWRSLLGENDLTKSGYLRNPSRQELIDMVSRSWARVTPECIRNSFVAAGIIPE